VRTQKTKGGEKKISNQTKPKPNKPNKPSDNNNYCLMHRHRERERERERER
jgi:hypothetical protein